MIFKRSLVLNFILLTILFILSGIWNLSYAQSSQDLFPLTKYSPRLELTLKGGNTRSMGRLGGVIPIVETNRGLLFSNIFGLLDSQTAQEGNIGIGYRHICNEDHILGGYIFYDYRKSEYNNRFNQITVGGEYLRENIEARANVYLPIGRKKQLVVETNKPVVANRELFVEEGKISERILHGFDVEVGGNLPAFKPLSGYITYYHFNAPGVRPVHGVRFRASLKLNEYISLEGEISRDRLREEQIGKKVVLFGGIKLNYIFGKKKEQLTGLGQKMTQMVIRDIDIVSDLTEETNNVITLDEQGVGHLKEDFSIQSEEDIFWGSYSPLEDLEGLGVDVQGITKGSNGNVVIDEVVFKQAKKRYYQANRMCHSDKTGGLESVAQKDDLLKTQGQFKRIEAYKKQDRGVLYQYNNVGVNSISPRETAQTPVAARPLIRPRISSQQEPSQEQSLMPQRTSSQLVRTHFEQTITINKKQKPSVVQLLPSRLVLHPVTQTKPQAPSVQTFAKKEVFTSFPIHLTSFSQIGDEQGNKHAREINFFNNGQIFVKYLQPQKSYTFAPEEARKVVGRMSYQLATSKRDLFSLYELDVAGTRTGFSDLQGFSPKQWLGLTARQRLGLINNSFFVVTNKVVDEKINFSIRLSTHGFGGGAGPSSPERKEIGADFSLSIFDYYYGTPEEEVTDIEAEQRAIDQGREKAEKYHQLSLNMYRKFHADHPEIGTSQEDTDRENIAHAENQLLLSTRQQHLGAFKAQVGLEQTKKQEVERVTLEKISRMGQEARQQRNISVLQAEQERISRAEQQELHAIEVLLQDIQTDPEICFSIAEELHFFGVEGDMAQNISMLLAPHKDKLSGRADGYPSLFQGSLQLMLSPDSLQKVYMTAVTNITEYVLQYMLTRHIQWPTRYVSTDPLEENAEIYLRIKEAVDVEINRFRTDMLDKHRLLIEGRFQNLYRALEQEISTTQQVITRYEEEQRQIVEQIRAQELIDTRREMEERRQAEEDALGRGDYTTLIELLEQEEMPAEPFYTHGNMLYITLQGGENISQRLNAGIDVSIGKEDCMQGFAETGSVLFLARGVDISWHGSAVLELSSFKDIVFSDGVVINNDGGGKLQVIADSNHHGVGSIYFLEGGPRITFTAEASRINFIENRRDDGIIAEDFVNAGAESFKLIHYIHRREDLELLSSFPKGGFLLTRDLDLGEEPFTPLGTKELPAKLFFDGNGKKITGRFGYLSSLPEKPSGLFGYLKKSLVRNLDVDGISINANQANVGLVAGHALKTTFERVRVRGKIQGGVNVGGMVGYQQKCFFKNCAVVDDFNAPPEGSFSAVDRAQAGYSDTWTYLHPTEGENFSVGCMVGWAEQGIGMEGCAVRGVKIFHNRPTEEVLQGYSFHHFPWGTIKSTKTIQQSLLRDFSKRAKDRNLPPFEEWVREHWRKAIGGVVGTAHQANITTTTVSHIDLHLTVESMAGGVVGKAWAQQEMRAHPDIRATSIKDVTVHDVYAFEPKLSLLGGIIGYSQPVTAGNGEVKTDTHIVKNSIFNQVTTNDNEYFNIVVGEKFERLYPMKAVCFSRLIEASHYAELEKAEKLDAVKKQVQDNLRQVAQFTQEYNSGVTKLNKAQQDLKEGISGRNGIDRHFGRSMLSNFGGTGCNRHRRRYENQISDSQDEIKEWSQKIERLTPLLSGVRKKLASLQLNMANLGKNIITIDMSYLFNAPPQTNEIIIIEQPKPVRGWYTREILTSCAIAVTAWVAAPCAAYLGISTSFSIGQLEIIRNGVFTLGGAATSGLAIGASTVASTINNRAALQPQTSPPTSSMLVPYHNNASPSFVQRTQGKIFVEERSVPENTRPMPHDRGNESAMRESFLQSFLMPGLISSVPRPPSMFNLLDSSTSVNPALNMTDELVSFRTQSDLIGNNRDTEFLFGDDSNRGGALLPLDLLLPQARRESQATTEHFQSIHASPIYVQATLSVGDVGAVRAMTPSRRFVDADNVFAPDIASFSDFSRLRESLSPFSMVYGMNSNDVISTSSLISTIGASQIDPELSSLFNLVKQSSIFTLSMFGRGDIIWNDLSGLVYSLARRPIPEDVINMAVTHGSFVNMVGELMRPVNHLIATYIGQPGHKIISGGISYIESRDNIDNMWFTKGVLDLANEQFTKGVLFLADNMLPDDMADFAILAGGPLAVSVGNKVVTSFSKNMGNILHSQNNLVPGVPGFITGGKSTILGRNMMETMGLKRTTRWTGYQAQHIIPIEMRNLPRARIVLEKIGFDLDHAANGLFLKEPILDINVSATHLGRHALYNKVVYRALKRMDVGLSANELEKKVFLLQKNLKYLQLKGMPLYPGKGARIEVWERALSRLAAQ